MVVAFYLTLLAVVFYDIGPTQARDIFFASVPETIAIFAICATYAVATTGIWKLARRICFRRYQPTWVARMGSGVCHVIGFFFSARIIRDSGLLVPADDSLAIVVCYFGLMVVIWAVIAVELEALVSRFCKAEIGEKIVRQGEPSDAPESPSRAY